LEAKTFALFKDLFEREREQERESERERAHASRGRERDRQATLSSEPDSGLDSTTLRS